MDQKSVADFIVTMDQDLRLLDMTRSEFVQSLYRGDADLTVGAIHEAGHCVTAWALGFQILEMSIDEFHQDLDGIRQPFSAYEVDPQRLTTDYGRTAFHRAVVAMAGIMAERRMTGILDDTAFEGDYEGAWKYVDNLTDDGSDFEFLFAEVLDDVDNILDEHWNKIEMLTLAAFKFGPVLNGLIVEEIIECA